MKLAVVISTNEPETVFNAFRLANFAVERDDHVRVFLLGRGVEAERATDTLFNVTEQIEIFAAGGGVPMACGTCLTLRNSAESEMCSISTMNDLYQLVQESDRVVTF